MDMVVCAVAAKLIRTTSTTTIVESRYVDLEKKGFIWHQLDSHCVGYVFVGVPSQEPLAAVCAIVSRSTCIAGFPVAFRILFSSEEQQLHAHSLSVVLVVPVACHVAAIWCLSSWPTMLTPTHFPQLLPSSRGTKHKGDFICAAVKVVKLLSRDWEALLESHETKLRLSTQNCQMSSISPLQSANCFCCC